MPKNSDAQEKRGPGQPKKCAYEKAFIRAIAADITHIARERKFDDGEIERALLIYKNEEGDPKESNIGKAWGRYKKGSLELPKLLRWVVKNALLPSPKRSYKSPEKSDSRAWLPQYWSAVFYPKWYWLKFQDEEVVSLRYVDKNGNPATEMRSQVERKADFDALANRLANADRLEDRIPRKWLEDFARDVKDECEELFLLWECQRLNKSESKIPQTPFLSEFLEREHEDLISNEFFNMEMAQQEALDYSVSLFVKAVEGNAKKTINCLTEALKEIECFEQLVPLDISEILWGGEEDSDGGQVHYVKCNAKKGRLDDQSIYLLSGVLRVTADQLGLSIGYAELLDSLSPNPRELIEMVGDPIDEVDN
jgi:hypothetical protein